MGTVNHKPYFIIKTIWEWIFAMTAFMAMNPYFMWDTLENGCALFLYRIFQVTIALGFVFAVISGRVRFYKKYFPYVFLLGFYFLYTNKTGLSSSSGLLIKLLIILSIVLLDDKLKRSILTKFTIIFAISLIPAIFYQIMEICNVKIPYSKLSPSQGAKLDEGVYYHHYFGAVEGYFRWSEGHVRLCGMFDEPGVVGTMAGLLLAANRRRKSWIRCILFIGGIFSLSFAFFVIYACYIGLVLLSEKKIMTIAMGMLGFVCVLFMLAQLPKENLIYRYTISRLEIKNGKLMADNRTSSVFEQAYNHYTKSIRIFTGAEKKMAAHLTHGLSSYKIVIFEYGIVVFCILVYLVIKANCFFENKRNKITLNDKSILIMLFLMSIYQRPNVINIPFLIVLYGGLANHAIVQRKCERNLNESIIIR